MDHIPPKRKKVQSSTQHNRDMPNDVHRRNFLAKQVEKNADGISHAARNDRVQCPLLHALDHGPHGERAKPPGSQRKQRARAARTGLCQAPSNADGGAQPHSGEGGRARKSRGVERVAHDKRGVTARDEDEDAAMVGLAEFLARGGATKCAVVDATGGEQGDKRGGKDDQAGDIDAGKAVADGVAGHEYAAC